MVNKYREIFEIYFKICKEKYDPKEPYKNLEECCIICEDYRSMLFGMITLLEFSKEITLEESAEERKKIAHTFSTYELFNASMRKGEVVVYR